MPNAPFNIWAYEFLTDSLRRRRFLPGVKHGTRFEPSRSNSAESQT